MPKSCAGIENVGFGRAGCAGALWPHDADAASQVPCSWSMQLWRPCEVAAWGSSTKSVGGRRLRGCRRRRQTCRRAGYSTYVVQMKWQTSILAVGALGCGRAPRLGMAPRAGLGACTRRAAERGHARPNLGHGCRPGAPRACPSPILERSGDVGRLRCGWGEVRPWTGP